MCVTIVLTRSPNGKSKCRTINLARPQAKVVETASVFVPMVKHVVAITAKPKASLVSMTQKPTASMPNVPRGSAWTNYSRAGKKPH